MHNCLQTLLEINNDNQNRWTSRNISSPMKSIYTLKNSTFQPIEWNETKHYTCPEWYQQYETIEDFYEDFYPIHAVELNDVIEINNPIVYGEEGIKMKHYAYIPNIKNVIFNAPATIVFWSDGSKTVVKCMDEDTYSKDVGLAMCFMKKMFEADDRTYIKKDKNGEHKETAYGYKKVFKKWIDDYGKEE